MDSARLPSVILTRPKPFEKFVSELAAFQRGGGGTAAASRRALALAAAAKAAGAAGGAAAPPLQCSVEAILATAFTRSVGGVHFCAANGSSSEDVLLEMGGAGADERTLILRWVTGATVAAFLGFLASRVQHLFHTYPTVFSLSLNTMSSVGLIFTNKVLYQRGCDYGT